MTGPWLAQLDRAMDCEYTLFDKRDNIGKGSRPTRPARRTQDRAYGSGPRWTPDIPPPPPRAAAETATLAFDGTEYAFPTQKGLALDLAWPL
jgi:hypothetical protein